MRDAVRDNQGRPIVMHTGEVRSAVGRRVELRFAHVEGRLVCVGLEIGPPVVEAKSKGRHRRRVFNVADDSELEPLRSTEIRLPLRDLIDQALGQAVELTEDLAWLGDREEHWRERLEPLGNAAKKGRKKPGRPRLHDDDHYRKVAAVYEERLRSGRRDPLQAVMAEFHVSKSTANSWARTARRRGFLTMDYFGGETADG